MKFTKIFEKCLFGSNIGPFLSMYTYCRVFVEMILGVMESHYENTPMQHTEKGLVVKVKIFNGKNLIFFLFLLKT